MTQERRILLLSCCQQKRSDPGLLPALQRYNGPAFKVVRKFLREHPQEAQSLSIVILSAQFGLIPSSQLLPYYDQRMTSERAHELRPYVLNELIHQLQEEPARKLFLHTGKAYMVALDGYDHIIPTSLEVATAHGTPGGRLSQLTKWLQNSVPGASTSFSVSPQTGTPRIRGIELAFTPTQVIETARQALNSEPDTTPGYQSWYVEVGTARVSPKWIVSQLTGLPASAFHTSDARRVLQQLGIPVYAV
jgi:Family of unknown function (DUF6884)